MGSSGAAVAPEVVRRLQKTLPAGRVVTDVDVLGAYSQDQARFCESGSAIALVRPTSTDEVATALRFASMHGLPVVPQGARTGLSGGANAVDGCLLLSLERMTKILSVDAGERVAVVQPGVVNADLSRAVLEEGLFYPPDPASWETSTLGGNIATNAGGLCCVKYGVTGDWVRGLEVVLADGSVLRTGRMTAKGVAGYDLTRLFVGSEGTLGVVTEATLSLRPAPATPRTAAALFLDVSQACRAVDDFMGSGASPSMLELMDAATIDVVSRYRDLGYPDDTGAVLIAQSDDADRAELELKGFADSCGRHGATDVLVADDEAEGQLLVAARRMVGPAHEALGAELVDDVCVPRARLADLVRGVAAIGRRYDVLVTCAGHAGDGNMHPAVVFDATDQAERERAHQAFEAIMRLGLDLGGTITGEHGVGALKRDWLATELGEVGLATHRSIKQALDPQNILNPGKVLGVR